MTRPYHRDPLSPLGLERNQRDRLRRSLNKARENMPPDVEVKLTAEGWSVVGEPTREELRGILATLLDG